ncbi:XdhC family protein [Streptomyces sp. NPDC028635]|uniref:XdhC family protein n=1 Tax=Streptomyces sp. NPDC028635 TaxID=3154800 RepID=UPI0033F093AE
MPSTASSPTRPPRSPPRAAPPACARWPSTPTRVHQARLTCGGQAEILLQPLSALPARWWDLLSDGADAALLTRLDASRDEAVSRVVETATDTTDAVAPHAGADFFSDAAAQARALLRRHRAGREVVPGGDGVVLIESCPAVVHLVIVGAGELAELLLAQARLLGWNATATEDPERARALLAARPAAACLIVLSHEPEVDVPVLHTALASGVPYVGALGSRHTQERRAAALLDTGLAKERLSDIHGPIGLDLGARTPAETALAICAEVLAALAGKP